MAQIAEGSATTTKLETAAERNARLQAAFNKASTSKKTTAAENLAKAFRPAQKESTSFVRRPVETVVPVVPAQTASPGFVRRPVAPAPPAKDSIFGLRPQGSQNILGGIVEAFIDAPYQDARKYTMPQYGAPAQPDIEQRRYNLPQFGTRSTMPKTLNRQQLAEAARLTGEAMFVYGKMPDVISTDVARELPFKPSSDQFKNLFQEAWGVEGFDTAEEWLTRLGYQEYEPGKWEILDPIAVTGYGDGVYQGGGMRSRGGSSASRGSGYASGGSLVNWRIGF